MLAEDPAVAVSPVQGDVGEQTIEVNGVLGEFGPWVRPICELLDDPGELPHGGVGSKRVGKRLRPIGLEDGVARPLVLPTPHELKALLIGVAEVLELVGLSRGEGHEAIDVDADNVVGVDPAELGGDHRSGVAALGPVVAHTPVGPSARPMPWRRVRCPSPVRWSARRTLSRGWKER
jgi:hypothetical protein